MTGRIDVLCVIYDAINVLDGEGLDNLASNLSTAADVIRELMASGDECAMRLSLLMKHSEDLVAHMRICDALSAAQGIET